MMNFTQKNLSCITWAHAVNSTQQLVAALKSNVDMIEADIVLGYVENKSTKEPIMAHPPVTHSDLSLVRFLMEVMIFNNIYRSDVKGIKLDFKSIEVFEESLHILKKWLPKMKCPVWLNADIVSGPAKQIKLLPVNPERFLTGCVLFPRAVLSIGWTTRWGPNREILAYTKQDIHNMLYVIERNKIPTTEYSITFPVRAGIAANSINALHYLLNIVNETNKATLTIWSSPDDYVDLEKLRELIHSFGPDQIYLDLPDSLKDKLKLPTESNSKRFPTFLMVAAGAMLAGLFVRRYMP